jgi:hypothetical protein
MVNLKVPKCFGLVGLKVRDPPLSDHKFLGALFDSTVTSQLTGHLSEKDTPVSSSSSIVGILTVRLLPKFNCTGLVGNFFHDLVAHLKSLGTTSIVNTFLIEVLLAMH